MSADHTSGSYPGIDLLRQQARDLDQLRADYVLKCTEYSDTTEFARGLIAERDELRGEIARHERNNTHVGKMFDQLRADLAAAVAERDEARTAYQVRNTEWHQNELIALALAERYKLRAEQAEARLAAIDAAPTVARIESLPGPRGGAYLYIMGVESPPNVSSGTELIARLAKDHL